MIQIRFLMAHFSAHSLHPLSRHVHFPHLSLYLLFQLASSIALHLQLYTHFPSVSILFMFPFKSLIHITIHQTLPWLYQHYNTAVVLHCTVDSWVYLNGLQGVGWLYFTGHFWERPFCVGLWATVLVFRCLEGATVV